MTDRQNVLVPNTDQQRTDSLGCYEAPVGYLSRAGYRTHLIRTWHLGTYPDRDAPRGFDDVVTSMAHDIPEGKDPDHLRYLKEDGVIDHDANVGRG